ncbi:MAG: hypothetical protein QOJ85_2291 [Solirubrobacteraceae bacterium]|nr:hypothetical protein [Solirubrobacteraceae bacterium]
MTNAVTFRLNGDVVTIEDPSPDLLLLDYLRSPDVALTGAKKGCGQGGCGACTVILSEWDETSQQVEHRSINSCLRPVCALGGLAVTTIEGTGAPARVAPAHLTHQGAFSRTAAPPGYVPPAVAEAARRSASLRSTALAAAGATGAAGHDGTSGDEPLPMNQVAFRLALNNGTQCGYCTPGFVMNMSALLAANPTPTKREIEDVFDGNLCRCTGYRAILTGMKTFASDWTEADEARRMQCHGEAAFTAQFRPAPVTIAVPADDPPRAQPVQASEGDRTWLTPRTIDELCRIMRDNTDRTLRLICGNTSFGIYPNEFLAAEVLVDIKLIGELHGVSVEPDGLRVGAAVTYSRFIEALDTAAGTQASSDTSCLGAAKFMARRTAGTIVRNAGSLAGNSMLVLAHIHAGTGEPFPSDLFTALDAIGAELSFVRASTGEPGRLSVDELIGRVLDDPELPRDIVLTAYHLPFGDPLDIVMAQKVALREVNAHSFVNATTRLTVQDDLRVSEAIVAYGGIAPYPWRARRTERAITGRPLSLDHFAEHAAILRVEVAAELERWKSRMAGEPSEGVTDEYRIELAVGFLYKALVNALLQRAPQDVPPEVASSGVITWGRWPVSDGTQHYEIQPWKAPVSVPYVKIMSLYQATGRVHYTHEIGLPPTALNAAFVQSRQALADYHFVVPGRDEPATPERVTAHLRERFSSFVDLVTHRQIPPQGINMQGMGADQPLFAVDRISYVGQAIALVVADTEQDAIDIAEYASDCCVAYGPVDWPPPWNEPVLSIDDALAIDSVFPDYPSTASYVSHVWKIIRPGSRLDWVTPKEPLDKDIAVRTPADVEGLECAVVESTQLCGGQVHFYMETQACVAIPTDADRLLFHPSTQSPMEMHQTAAMALGVHYHKLEVDVVQVGGGYGGKTEQARFVIGPAAVAANTLRKPLRLVMKREHDTAMIGKRHAYYGQYQIAIDLGTVRADDRGLIRGMHCKMWGDGGAFYDCSFVVSNCIQLRADNAYLVPNFENQIDVCRTNKAPNTAMRAFGDIQGKIITENAIDDAAFELGMSAEDVREKNFYDRGDVTPFGQALSYCYMKDVWSYLKDKSRYDERKAEVDAFNEANRWTKRGIAMVPVKYGSGYNFLQLEQAAAHVAVNAGDGSIVVHQGGVEMGQGALTIVEQVASYVLNVPMDLLRIESPDTSVLPNPSSTGASTGTPYNAAAVKQTCQLLRERLTEFGYSMLKVNGPQWCSDMQIDFWNYGEKGWATEVDSPGGGRKLIWQNVVAQAFAQRVSLIASFTAPMLGGETPVPAMTFKPMSEQPTIPGITVDENAPVGGAVTSFTGFTYSAACSVVEIDVLTGETKVLSSDLVYDAGWSLNPAIDVGQVEGAFVQGVGYVLTEQLVYEPDGEEKGRLNTLNTWRYKPPATVTIPLELNTYLFPRNLAANVPEDPNELFSSKEIGEPPLVLASTVFFAVKYAIRASRVQRGLAGLFRLDAPATVQEVRRACAVTSEEMAAGSSS